MPASFGGHLCFPGSCKAQCRGLMGDAGDIEAEHDIVPVERFEVEPARLERVVTRDRVSRDPAAQHCNQDEVAPKRAIAAVLEDIDSGENALSLGLGAGFFEEFAQRSIADGFARLDLAPGKPQRPASGGLARRTSSTCWSRITVAMVAAMGRGGADDVVTGQPRFTESGPVAPRLAGMLPHRFYATAPGVARVHP